MKKITTILLTLSCSLATFAQSDTTHHSKQFLTFYGIQSPDLTELNTVFSAYKYPQLNANNFSVGLGLMKFKKNILMQEDFYTYTQSQRKDTMTSSIRSYGICQSFGYPYLMKQKFQMYSLVGFNYTWTTIKVSKDIASSTPFNTYSSSIGNQLEMTTWAFTVNVATHINYLIKISKDPNDKDRLVLGIRGGYHIPIMKTEWMMNKAKLDKGPNINPGGYYAMLILGFTF